MSRSQPETELPSGTAPRFYIRRPVLADGPSMWELVKGMDGLEANTLYAYLLFTQDFSATCRVAEGGDGIGGLVVGYRLPARADTLFVWQVGVHPRAQGQGLAGRMILDILGEEGEPRFRFLEATVAEGNIPSRGLFESLARRLKAECTVSEGFAARHFHPQQHPPERRFHIGPFGGDHEDH